MTAHELGRQLLLAVRAADAAAAERAERALAALTEDALALDLADDHARLATWINLYNAATQRLVDRDPGAYRRRMRFFRRPAITVAGRALSLDAIEHGLLRRSRWKAGLGWLGNPLPGAFERRLRVRRVDPRVHFALNCAAASCPPIAAYQADRLDAQLDLATRSYLAATVRRDGDRLVVPRVFRWFPGDFGGRAGTRRFLAQHGIPADGLRLQHAPWDWRPAPDAWASEDGTPPEPEENPDA
jgi:hypothetical protein